MIKIKITYCCMDCGDKISLPTALYGNGRCGKCSHTGSLHPRLGVKLSKKTKGKISKSLIGKMTKEKCYLYKDGRSSKQYYCKDCNGKVYYSTALYGKGYCTQCKSKGERNPNWRGGINKLPYSFSWTIKLKENIKKRDGYKCIRCGITQKRHIALYGKKSPVHHIDYNKQNCEESNLVTTCIKCNSEANYNRDYWYAYYTYLMEHKNNIWKLG